MSALPLTFHPSSLGCFDNIRLWVQNKKPTAAQLSPVSHYLLSLSGNIIIIVVSPFIRINNIVVLLIISVFIVSS